MIGDQPGESKSRGQTSQHTQSHNLYLPLALHLIKNNQPTKKKKKHVMVEHLQFICHPSLNWLLLWLSKWPSCHSMHIVPFLSKSSYLWRVSKTHNMLLQYGMYCYRMLCNRGNDWMTNSKISCNVGLNNFVKPQRQRRRETGMCVCVIWEAVNVS